MADDPASHSPAEGLWAFSLDLYARPGAADACLLLQDRHGLDVNLGLFALWLGARGYALDDATLAAAQAAAGQWHRQVVVPLRAARRFLKPLAEDPAVAGLREAVKAAELEAERLEQRRLESLTAPGISSDAGTPSAPGTPSNASTPSAAGSDLPGDNLLRLLPTALDRESRAAVTLLATLAASALPGQEV